MFTAGLKNEVFGYHETAQFPSPVPSLQQRP